MKYPEVTPDAGARGGIVRGSYGYCWVGPSARDGYKTLFHFAMREKAEGPVRPDGRRRP